MRFLGVLVVSFLLLGAAWSKLVTQDGLIKYYDKNPGDRLAPSAMYYLGRGYEIVGNYEKMLATYGRVADRYPSSSYAEVAHFGVAFALERSNHYPEAIKKYEEFLEKYPRSKYAQSVRNNIEILRSR